MKTTRFCILVGCAAFAATTTSFAQTTAAPPSPTQRARGPGLPLALEAAQAAVVACAADGFHASVLVADSGDVPVVLLSSGAGPRSIDVVATKIAATLKYKIPSSEVAERAKTDAALEAEIKTDPKIGVAYPGALPLLVDGQLIGALAVSGTSSGGEDEVCAKVGVAQVASRLK